MPDGDNAFQGMSAHRIYDRLVKMGEAWADQDAAAKLFEDLEKSRLAQITLALIEAEDVTRAVAETRALASEEYQDHKRQSIEARRLANRLRVQYEQGKMWVDLMRSQNANRRAEMTMGGIIT